MRGFRRRIGSKNHKPKPSSGGFGYSHSIIYFEIDMNSKQKKISALLQTLTKLGHDRDAEIEIFIKGVQDAIGNQEGQDPSSERGDIVTKTDQGVSIKIPLFLALKQLGILKDLKIPETLLDEDEDEPHVNEDKS